MNLKINYIVANYVGPLRHYIHYQNIFKSDPLYFFKKHLEFINSSPRLKNVTASYIFNDDINDMIKNYLATLDNKNYEILLRKNSGFSYGIWNDIIIKNINDYDYFFLIEDDYIPTRIDFLDHFLKRIKNNTAFVCGLVEQASAERYPSHVSKDDGCFPFASISNGLISAAACREVYKKHGTVFKINLNTDYSSAYSNQIYFYKYFTDMGYGITDTLDEFNTPYNNATHRHCKVYGNKEDVLLEPLIL